MDTFYNIDGRAVAFLDDDGQSLYLYDGTPAGFVQDDGVYAYSGKFLGWFDQEWVRNLRRRGKARHRPDGLDLANAAGGPGLPDGALARVVS